jgi:hypothetical protein
VKATTRTCRICDVPLSEEVEGDRCEQCKALASRRAARVAIDRAKAATL